MRSDHFVIQYTKTLKTCGMGTTGTNYVGNHKLLLIARINKISVRLIKHRAHNEVMFCFVFSPFLTSDRDWMNAKGNKKMTGLAKHSSKNISRLEIVYGSYVLYSWSELMELMDIITFLLILIPIIVGCNRDRISNRVVEYAFRFDEFMSGRNVSSNLAAIVDTYSERTTFVEMEHNGEEFVRKYYGRDDYDVGYNQIGGIYEWARENVYDSMSHLIVSEIAVKQKRYGEKSFCNSLGKYYQVARLKSTDVNEHGTVILGTLDIDWENTVHDKYNIVNYRMIGKEIGYFRHRNTTSSEWYTLNK